jgi:septal ring factor EnvC (AmiA/AmiB activator)
MRRLLFARVVAAIARARTALPYAVEFVAPKQQRLRSLLVYTGVMLAGGLGGMALAYDLLAQLLDQRSAEIRRQELRVSTYSKSLADLEIKLDQQQARRIEAETRLAATLADSERKLSELQAMRAETRTQLASAPAGHPGQAGRIRKASCTLGSGNVRSVLNGCIADMNRK